MDEKEYVLGTDDQELVRLGLQHRLWAEAATRLWDRARIVPGSRVLDVGCGPGFAAADLAALVGPAGRVVGIDESARFVDFLRARAAREGLQIEAHLGDVHDVDDMCADGAPFDAAWIRWVLCFLRDPERVIAQVARLLRPGARLAIHDYFSYGSMTLAPRREAFSRGIAAVHKSWIDAGGDPDVIAKIPGILRRQGFRLLSLECPRVIANHGDQIWTWPTVFWPNFMPRLVAKGYLSQAEFEAFLADWNRAKADPDSFFFLPPVFEVVAEKE
ncbi:MAG: methyltransferase domain-containing protein [Phycisphaeraceae bacterium]|nr:methyltransferase domain-containing protein [Phycisphaeraceae bacterium]